MRRFLLIVVASLSIPAWSAAQSPQYRWQPGQVLTYKVAQITTVTEKIGDKSTVATTQLDVVKKWQVAAVNAEGVATLTMSLDRLRMETKSPTGEVLLFDSLAKAKSTPALTEEMTKYLGVPLTSIRINNRGELVEVKESKFGPASRLEADLPFKLVLPATGLAVGQTWERDYKIKLEPPQGAGETYPAKQKFTCKAITGPTVVIGVGTTVSGPPEQSVENIALMPLQPTGEVVFEVTTGRLKSVRYQWTKAIDGLQGDGSKYTFASTYVEEMQ